VYKGDTSGPSGRTKKKQLKGNWREKRHEWGKTKKQVKIWKCCSITWWSFVKNLPPARVPAETFREYYRGCLSRCFPLRPLNGFLYSATTRLLRYETWLFHVEFYHSKANLWFNQRLLQGHLLQHKSHIWHLHFAPKMSRNVSLLPNSN